MEMHGLREEDIECTLAERRRINPDEYNWLNTLTDGNYTSSMQEAPLFRDNRFHNLPREVYFNLCMLIFLIQILTDIK